MSKKAVSKEEKPTVPKKEEKKADVKSQKSEKPKTEKKKQQKGAHAMYKMENDKITRIRPTCERCGPGYFMADHNDRYTCGHCGFTRYKRA
jgi:ubiquitin-small subunit ribosomal protein S27Ae